MNSMELIRPRRNRERSIVEAGIVYVFYGGHSLEIEIAGLSVAEARLALRDILSVGDSAGAFVNQNRVFCEDVILRPGDTLVFLRWRGRKGSDGDLRRIATALERIGNTLDEISRSEKRIAEHFDPQKRKVVGTAYVAEQLGVTIKWAGDLVRRGDVPKSCICPKSGEGRYWRFWKDEIDKWIEEK